MFASSTTANKFKRSLWITQFCSFRTGLE